MSWLERIKLRRKTPASASALLHYKSPQPGEPVTVIGDIHGCDRLLRAALKSLEELPGAVVTVGDYIDRGPGSAEVLRLLRERSGPDFVCLSGNHEDMMLGFLDDPLGYGPAWLLNGGHRTLASFGIVHDGHPNDPAALARTASALRAAIGGDLETWLRELNLWWRSGNVAVVHAGADPSLPIDAQDPQALRWGAPGFGQPREDGLWVVHGHTIVPEPEIGEGTIAVDTGAFLSGTLTAVHIDAGTINFISIRDDEHDPELQETWT